MLVGIHKINVSNVSFPQRFRFDSIFSFPRECNFFWRKEEGGFSRKEVFRGRRKEKRGRRIDYAGKLMRENVESKLKKGGKIAGNTSVYIGSAK